jgi:hypothetical protein
VGITPSLDRPWVIGMEPPIGFVTLHDAVDGVGHTVFGAHWQYAVPRSGEADKETDAHERVITLVAEGCEAGAIEATYRKWDGGVDALDHSVWRLPHWRSFFARGTIDLDLPLLDASDRPNPSGHTARCTREIFVRRASLERFILELSSDRLPAHNLADASPPGRGGMATRPPSRGPKAGVFLRVVEEMRRDLRNQSTTAARLTSEPEKALAAQYSASRDTVRKARNIVLSKLVET